VSDEETLTGQVRWNVDATECLCIFGTYGYGSGGSLYSVSRPLGPGELLKIQFENKIPTDNIPGPRTAALIRAPNGMSHEDILEAYPRIQCDECKGSGNSCCNGPCHKCNGDLALRRSRLERI